MGRTAGDLPHMQRGIGGHKGAGQITWCGGCIARVYLIGPFNQLGREHDRADPGVNQG